MNTGEMLDLLAAIGRPSPHRMSDGCWHANLKMPAPEGVTVEIGSDFKHPTHDSALTQLIARLGEVTNMGAKIATLVPKPNSAARPLQLVRNDEPAAKS